MKRRKTKIYLYVYYIMHWRIRRHQVHIWALQPAYYHKTKKNKLCNKISKNRYIGHLFEETPHT